MKLGIIAGPSEKSFKMAFEKGLEFVEFCINVKNDTGEFFKKVDNIGEWKEKYNVAVGSIGRWGSRRIDTDGNIIPEELEISYKLIDSAKKLGCENFVCGCNYVNELSLYENYTAAINYFSRLIEYAESKGVKISVYNCKWANFVVDDISWKIVHGYLKDLGIKFDPSHSRYAGRDYLKEMSEWGERFYHVHIKGSLIIAGERYDDPPAGFDQTNWGAFMDILYTKGYTGGLSIEPHSKYWKGEIADFGVDYTINFIKRLIYPNS